MNYIWFFTIVLSIAGILFSGNVTEFSTVLSYAASDAVELILSLAGIMALWGGLMEIAERSGITEFISKLLSPIISKLFGSIKGNKDINSAVSMNITANVLGLGNAATPLGIEAMRRMKSVSQNGDTATDAMVTFVIINTASVQLIPATTAMLRAQYGSSQPMAILPAVLLASVCSLAVGLLIDVLLRKVKYA